MASSSRQSYTFGAFRLDPVGKILFRGNDPAPLTPKAVETLLVLVERHGQVVTKDELIRIVWPDTFVEENNLAQNISLLRRVLGDNGGPQFIETVPKRGYRFVGPVVDTLRTTLVRSPCLQPSRQRKLAAFLSCGCSPQPALPQRLLPLWRYGVRWARPRGCSRLP